jgi:hypothetical protein
MLHPTNRSSLKGMKDIMRISSAQEFRELYAWWSGSLAEVDHKVQVNLDYFGDKTIIHTLIDIAKTGQAS